MSSDCAGDFVPADIKLADGELHVDQSSLTGESGEVTKAKVENVRVKDSFYVTLKYLGSLAWRIMHKTQIC